MGDVKRKTVTQTIEEVIEEVCNNYCKFQEEIKTANTDEELDALIKKYCDGCPLNRL